MSRYVTPRFFQIGNKIFNPAYIKLVEITNESTKVTIRNTMSGGNPVYCDTEYEYSSTKNTAEYKQVMDMVNKLQGC